MKPDYKNTLLKKNGKTSDIVDAVMTVYKKDYEQVNDLAKTFETNNIEETCRNIFDYVVDHVQYREDESGVQWVKNPARLIAEGTGDCKSMAIFSAACLRCLNIPHVFRFVSFNGNKEVTHVYVVAFDEQGKEIIIDPVVRPIQFNKEEKYTYKSDMNGTNIYYLSGIPKRKSIGNTDISIDELLNRMQVWTGDDNPEIITPGKYWLYTEFDLYTELYNIATSLSDKIAALNRISIISALLWAYNEVNGATEAFQYQATVICGLIAEGYFNSSTTDLNKRSEEFNGITAVIKEKTAAQLTPAIYDPIWYDLIDENILQQNNPVSVPQVTGIGNIIEDLNGTTAANKIKAGAMYHLFQFVPDNEVANYPASLARKRDVQTRTFTFIHKTDPWHNEASVRNLIRSGIIAQTGMTPENYLKSETAKNKISGIGWIEVVLGILQIVIALVALLKSLFGGKSSVPSEDEIQSAIPDATDLQTKKTTVSTSSVSMLLLIGGAGLLGGSFLSKKKKNKNKSKE